MPVFSTGIYSTFEVGYFQAGFREFKRTKPKAHNVGQSFRQRDDSQTQRFALFAREGEQAEVRFHYDTCRGAGRMPQASASSVPGRRQATRGLRPVTCRSAGRMLQATCKFSATQPRGDRSRATRTGDEAVSSPCRRPVPKHALLWQS